MASSLLNAEVRVVNAHVEPDEVAVVDTEAVSFELDDDQYRLIPERQGAVQRPKGGIPMKIRLRQVSNSLYLE